MSSSEPSISKVALDADQQRAVDHEGSPLLLLGGPGTGKTLVLERRYLQLASRGDLAPHRILFLCSHRRYSMEAKDKLLWELPHEATIEVPVYTWHALAYHLVTRYYPRLGYREPPVLLTAPEQWGVVRELLAAENSIDWPVWAERLRERAFVDEIADFCLRVEQRMVTDEVLESMERSREGWDEVVRFFGRYRDYLVTESRLDYAGLIAAAVTLLDGDEAVRAALRKRFPHVLVDDGQEISFGERELLMRLETSNLVVAADPDSGIETFRGAEPDWIYGFEKWFGSHEVIELQTSHRLGEPMLSSALDLIANNDTDAAHRPSVGAPHQTVVDARQYGSAAEEVEAVAREIRHIHLSDGVPWGGIAVLVSQPAFLHSPLVRALDRWEVPYDPMSRDRPLASEPAIACFLDLVRVALATEGWEAVVPNLLTGPLIGLDYPTRRRIERDAWQKRRSLIDLIEEVDETEEFRRLRDIVRAHAARADECFWEIYSASIYYRNLSAKAVADPSDPANDDLDALVAFSHALGRFVERRHGRGSISDYLNEAARADFGGDPWLPPSRSGEGDHVSLLTFHSSRGRQWDTVFVTGCLDTWIPKGRRAQGLFDPFALEISDAVDREVEAIADDRRTFYVAATRAKSKTIFTFSPGPSGRGRATRFLAELGAHPLEVPEAGELPPLTFSEFRSRLRRVLGSTDRPDAEKAAAVVALSEIPGTDPSRWYGRWQWTEGSVPLTNEGVLRTSYSRLDVFKNCGLQYVLQSVLGLDPVSSEAMKFGTWIHALFQAVHDGLIRDIPTLVREYRAIFDESAFPNAAIANQYRRDGEKMLKLFWEHEFMQDDVMSEFKFEFPYDQAVLRGRIDRIDRLGKSGTLKLTDYKTSKWTMSFKAAKESLQLAIYFLAARMVEELREKGVPKVARLVYPGVANREGKPMELCQNDEQADKVIETLPQLISDVIEEKFNPSPVADCYFCQMKPLCPIWPAGREVEV
jgi:superfamily I DNA/RNA helicase/RecB family exonuclease